MSSYWLLVKFGVSTSIIQIFTTTRDFKLRTDLAVVAILCGDWLFQTLACLCTRIVQSYEDIY